MAINYGSLQATLTPKGVVSGKVQNATRAFVKDYDLLDNKPKVNGVELSGDKSLEDLGIEIPEIVANPGDTTENLTSIGIDGVNYNIQGSGGSAVASVNGKTGDVMLDAEDVGALPDDTPIPSELADLSEDSTHRTVTDTEKTAWNAKADISDLPTVNNSTITIQKNNQNIDSFTLNQDSNKSINISVPTKTSDLQNDNSFITNTVNNLANYYLKTQTYTQAEVDALIQAAVNGRFQKVNSLPASGEPNVIYLVPKTTPETSNACDEYIWQDNAWELIGSTEIDLSDYVTDEDLTTALADYLTTSAFNTAIANYYTKTEVSTLLDNKVDKENGKGLSTYDYDATAKAIVDSVTANLATKVDKVAGKGLSTNNYDNTAKDIVDNVTSNLANKVDKEQGKGLSTNDYNNTAKGIVDGVTNALAGKANISEMSVTDGTGSDADKTTIQLKSGTSATVLKTHQDISGKADKVLGATNGNLAGLDANGNLTDSGVAKTDIDDMQDELSTDSIAAIGNPINFSTLTSQNAESTIIDLEPIQDLHGYDKPWVGGAGKNKLAPFEGGIKETTTLVVNSDGSAYFSGTATSAKSFDFERQLKAGTYILSGAPNGSSQGSYDMFISLSGSVIARSYSGSNLTQFTLESDSTVTVGIRASSGTLDSTKVFYPMIRLSTESDATFEPYSNLCPISGRTEIGILGCGKNLINPSELEQGSINSTTGEETVASTRVRTGYISVTDGYYVTSIESDKVLTAYRLYDENKNYIGSGGNTNPININGAKYVRIIFNNSQSTDIQPSDITSAQFELGLTATPYEPYTKSNDLTISLGQTVYGGTLDVKNGTLTVTDGYIASYNGETLPSTWISSMDEYVAGTTPTTGAEVCYTLATPTVINLTPHTINLLKGVNNISTDGDKITLTYRDGKVATLGDLLEVEKKIPSATAQHNYSTEEQVVGKWHNGKTLYEKTVEFNNVSNSGDASFGIANVETIFLISGMSSNSIPLPYVHGSAPSVNVGGFFTITAQDTSWSFRCGSSAPSTLSGFLIVRYTKTTAQGE